MFECRETRLTEAVDNICERILEYNVHAERPGSLRYAKVINSFFKNSCALKSWSRGPYCFSLCVRLTFSSFVCLQGSSQTMTTLKNLVHKGVQVDLGMPYELWDEPSVEVTDMKKQVGVCVCVLNARFAPYFVKCISYLMTPYMQSFCHITLYCGGHYAGAAMETKRKCV